MKRLVTSIFSLLILASTFAEDAKKIDPNLVGNFFSFFNPTAGGGTQMWNVDIDDTGSYMAFCTNADFDAVRGQLEFAGDKWTLKNDDKVIDQGTFAINGPQITLSGAKGSMMLSKVNPQSKQSILKEFNIDPKKAKVNHFLSRGLKMAREWRKDAILVNVRCTPDIDGNIDLTMQGGNLMLMYYCPTRDSGALAMVSAWGEISLMPQKEPVSPWKLPIPTNIVDVSVAVKTANDNGIKRVKDAELYGRGDDPDLRTYCWVMRTDNGVVCVDAVIPQMQNYNEFMNGRRRAGGELPFAPNSGIVSRVSVFGNGIYYMYYYRKHAVFLDGVDEAIMIRVPWRYVKEVEWKKFVTYEKDGAMMIGDLTGKLSAGNYTPLTADEFERLSKDSDALLLDGPPKLVLLESCPKELRPRVKAQLECYWRARETAKWPGTQGRGARK